MSTELTDKQRIAELEAELARLRKLLWLDPRPEKRDSDPMGLRP